MSSTILLIGLFSLAIGFGVLWANPPRWLNRAFFLVSIIQLAWFGCIYGTIEADAKGSIESVEFWLRLNAAVSAILPLSIWIIKESIFAKKQGNAQIARFTPWLFSGIALVALAYCDSFAIRRLNESAIHRGYAYYIYESIAISLYLYLTVNVIVQIHKLTGIRRTEAQFIAFNFGLAALVITLLTTLGNFLQIIALKRLSIMAIFSAYAACAWAITAHRVFDVRQVFTLLAQRVGLVLLLCSGTVGATWWLTLLLPQSVALLLSISVFCSLAFWLDRISRAWLDLDGDRKLAEARRAFIEVALQESNPDYLTEKFTALLCEQCQTGEAALLFAGTDAHVGPTVEFRKARPGYVALCETGWATPESLERRRPDPMLTDLQHFLIKNSLGTLVVSPRGSRQPSLLVALGKKNNSWPFTYPEVKRLQNLAELMDNVLTRARLATQAAAQAKMEHLAMMSRGLAHDLRNLITPISSFLVHTDGRFPDGSPEADVHAAARHSVRVMTDYVREALFFSERLSPNFQHVDFPRLFLAVSALAAPHAAERNVTISIESNYGEALSGDFVLLQRMLVNLTSNALDASKPGQSVTISASPGAHNRVLIKVSDQGCGVSAENIGKIFDPYFTTKEFGNDVRGFGLGLTICQKIVHLHKGSISVESQPDKGAIFTVDLPVNPCA